MRVLHAKVHRHLRARRGRIAALLVQPERLEHRIVEALAERELLRIDDPAVAYEPRETPHRVRAATEPEQVDVVAGMVVIDEKSIALLDVAIEPVARCTTHHAIDEPARPHTGMVVRELRRAIRRALLHELVG